MSAKKPMTANEKRKLFRQLMNAPEILALPGVFDGFSARLVEQAGYPAAFITGSGVAAQEKFPTRPVQMVMPTPPGGGTDILGRKLAEAVEPFLKQ